MNLLPEPRTDRHPEPAILQSSGSVPLQPYGAQGYPPQMPQDLDGLGGLIEYWRIICRRKWTVILLATLTAMASVALTLSLPHIYQAQASIEIQGMNERFLNMADVSPTATEGNGSTPEYDIQTQLRVLQSRSLLERIVAKPEFEKRLMGAELHKGGLLSTWLRRAGILAARKAPSRGDLVATAAENLKVRAQASTRVIDIQFDSPDAHVAADFANTLAAEYAEQNLESRWRTARDTSEWLSRHLVELKINLEESERQLQDYARTSGLIFTGNKDNIAEDKLRQLQQDVSKARAERMAKQSRYEMAAKSSPDSLPDVIDDATLKDYQVKAADLRRQLAELMASLTPANPSVKKVQAQIASFETALQHRRDDLVQRVRNEYETAQRREDLLTADYDAHSAFVTQQSAKVAHYDVLKHEVDTNRQIYESLLQHGKEAAVASALRANNVRVIDAAKAPEKPYKPSLPINASAGLFSGLFLGMVAAVLKERGDRTIRRPGDASGLNIREIGIIPSHNFEPLRGQPSIYGMVSAAAMSGQRHSGERQNLMTEAFRAILPAIIYSGKNGDRPKVIVVTSANPGEGKTTIIANIGAALARINQRVLLIDGDLRKPRLHKLFNVENTAGLTEYLNGTSAAPAFQTTSTSGLSIMVAGNHSDADILYSPKLGALIGRLRSEFDVILIDTPPILPVSDARVFSRHADAVILVLRSRQTTVDAARETAECFAEDGTQIMGTVLNDWNPKVGGYGKYYGHHYANVS